MTPCPMVIHSCAKHGMTMSKTKSCGPKIKPFPAPYNFDLKVKGQRRIGIMNVRHTLSHVPNMIF